MDLPNPTEEERQRFLSKSCYKAFGTFLSRSLNFLLSSEAPTAFGGARLLVGGSRQDWPGPLPRLSLWPRRQRSSPSDASAEFASPDDRSPSPLEYLRRSTEATPLGDTTVLQPQLRGSRVADGLAGALALVWSRRSGRHTASRLRSTSVTGPAAACPAAAGAYKCSPGQEPPIPGRHGHTLPARSATDPSRCGKRPRLQQRGPGCSSFANWTSGSACSCVPRRCHAPQGFHEREASDATSPCTREEGSNF